MGHTNKKSATTFGHDQNANGFCPTELGRKIVFFPVQLDMIIFVMKRDANRILSTVTFKRTVSVRLQELLDRKASTNFLFMIDEQSGFT